jgi:hypothetical protein
MPIGHAGPTGEKRLAQRSPPSSRSDQEIIAVPVDDTATPAVWPKTGSAEASAVGPSPVRTMAPAPRSGVTKGSELRTVQMTTAEPSSPTRRSLLVSTAGRARRAAR